jgi:hypothetical protein
MGEADAGSQGNARGVRAVDFKQGTWNDGELAPRKRDCLSK